MSKTEKKKHPRVIALPRVTREMTLEQDPDLAWSRDDAPHTLGLNTDSRLAVDYDYEGRSTG